MCSQIIQSKDCDRTGCGILWSERPLLQGVGGQKKIAGLTVKNVKADTSKFTREEAVLVLRFLRDSDAFKKLCKVLFYGAAVKKLSINQRVVF